MSNLLMVVGLLLVLGGAVTTGPMHPGPYGVGLERVR
jgi:hypothetical protein